MGVCWPRPPALRGAQVETESTGRFAFGSACLMGCICHRDREMAPSCRRPERRQPRDGRISQWRAVADHRAITPLATKGEKQNWRHPAWRGKMAGGAPTSWPNLVQLPGGRQKLLGFAAQSGDVLPP